MPPRHRDHQRVMRCARLYIDGEIEFDAAVERSGVSRGALWMVVKRLRAEAKNDGDNAGTNLRG